MHGFNALAVGLLFGGKEFLPVLMLLFPLQQFTFGLTEFYYWDRFNDGPVLDEDFLSGLMRQSMALDLSDLMEEFTFETESTPALVGSVISLIDHKEAKAIARKARAAMRKALKELAEQENIPLWQRAITQWINQHQEEKVSLQQLQQALGMPLVEVWLGLLHSPKPYQWDATGEFYKEAQEVWISGYCNF